MFGKSKEKKSAKADSKVGLGLLLRWQSSAASVSIATLMLGYVQIFCTDAIHIDPLVVGTIFLISKIFDSVTDVIVGFIVDRTQTKWGKGRPYEIFMLFLWVATWGLFSCPDSLAPVAKYIWIFFMYTFINAICVTFLNGNNVAYMVRAFKTKEQQTKVTAFGSVVTYIAAMVYNIMFPKLMAEMATSAAGWSRLVGMFALPLTAIGLLRILTVPEKYEVEETSKSKEKVSLKEVLLTLKDNKYLIMICAVRFIWTMITNMGVTVYYWTYIVGDVGKMGVVAAASAVSLPLAFVMPAFIKKVGMGKGAVYGFGMAAAGYLLMFFAGANIPIIIIASLCSLVGVVPFSMMGNMYIVDCAAYNEHTGHRRIEGSMGSVIGLFGKIGGAFGSFVLGLMLSLGGYQGEAAVQSGSAILMIRLLSSIIPLVAYVIVVIIMRFYDLDKILPEMKAREAVAE